jgi:hypothetical protein
MRSPPVALRPFIESWLIETPAEISGIEGAGI